MKKLNFLISLVLVTLLFAAANAQTTLTPTICFFAPDVHPNLNEAFTITLSATNITEPLDATVTLTWNSSNLQIQSASNGTYTADSYTLVASQITNQSLATVTFIANSTEPANLHLTASSTTTLNYFVPYYAPFNSVTT